MVRRRLSMVPKELDLKLLCRGSLLKEMHMTLTRNRHHSMMMETILTVVAHTSRVYLMMCLSDQVNKTLERKLNKKLSRRKKLRQKLELKLMDLHQIVFLMLPVEFLQRKHLLIVSSMLFLEEIH